MLTAPTIRSSSQILATIVVLYKGLERIQRPHLKDVRVLHEILHSRDNFRDLEAAHCLDGDAKLIDRRDGHDLGRRDRLTFDCCRLFFFFFFFFLCVWLLCVCVCVCVYDLVCEHRKGSVPVDGKSSLSGRTRGAFACGTPIRGSSLCRAER